MGTKLTLVADIMEVQPGVGTISIQVHVVSEPAIFQQLHAARQLALEVHEGTGPHVGVVSAVLHSGPVPWRSKSPGKKSSQVPKRSQVKRGPRLKEVPGSLVKEVLGKRRSQSIRCSRTNPPAPNPTCAQER